MENEDELRLLRSQIIRKDKWWDLLSRFIEVLRINLFIVDHDGRMVLPPEEYKFGGRLLLDRSLHFDCLDKCKDIPRNFVTQSKYLESKQRYDLRVYAIPIITETKTIAYVIVGPVRWHKTHEIQTEQWAKEYDVDCEFLTSELNELRVVSHVMLNSILDLLSEMISNHVELTLRELKNGSGPETVGAETSLNLLQEAADEIYSTVRLDELLVTLLDVALKMTETEAGSIMILDETDKTLTIKVSKGINSENVQNSRMRLGEGIAGIACAEKAHFLIDGQHGDSRIAHLLKRPTIKRALVMPLAVKDRIYGVLNLHTNKDTDKISDNLDNLQYLTRLLSSVF